MARVKIRTARPEEEAQVLGTIVLAFGSDPFLRWLYPGPGEAPHGAGSRA